MPIVKCQNPECDYFQKPVPEGDFCPFCGEPLGSQPSLSSGFPPAGGPSQPTYSPQLTPLTPPVAPTKPIEPVPPPYPPVVQTPVTPPQPVQPAPPPYPPVIQTPVTPPQPVPPPYPPVVQTPVTPSQPVPPSYPPVVQTPVTPIVAEPVYPPTVEPDVTPVIPSGVPDPGATMYESPRSFLRLVHSSGKEFMVIPGQKAYLGRRGGQKKPYPEIDLTDIPYAERISRPHAHIFWDETARSYMIVDNQSANGTIINGEVLQPWRPYSLQNGSTLELGKEHHIRFNVLVR